MSKLLMLISLSFMPYFAKGQIKQLQSVKEILAYYPDNKFIVFGETHGIDIINEVRLETIKHYLNKGKTLHVLLEMGKSQERLLNNFLFENGQETDDVWFPRPFLDSIKLLTQQFPQKLYIHGVDLELSLTAYVMELVSAADSIKDMQLRQDILNLGDINNKDSLSLEEKRLFKQKIDAVVQRCDDYLIKSPIKSSYLIDLIHRGTISFKWSKKMFPWHREPHIYKNIQRILKAYPNDNFYFQVGSYHAYKPKHLKWIKMHVVPMLQNNPKSLVYHQVFNVGLGFVACKTSWKGYEIKGEITNLTNKFYHFDKDLIQYFGTHKATKPTAYVWQPKKKNKFNLYLMAEKYDEQQLGKRKKGNHLHLLN